MASTDSSEMQANGGDTHEFSVRIELLASPWIHDDQLEQLTMRVEDALNADASEIAPGASASANFLTRAIELDLTIASSPIAIHGLVGDVTRVALESIEPDSVSFRSSTTSSALACAA
jgi:hypothetical protein